jgi:hypothetical protein
MAVMVSFSGQSAQSIECANAVYAQTEARSNEAGLKVALQMHAHDDHSKESHLCMTEYAFLLVRPDGSSTGTGVRHD